MHEYETTKNNKLYDRVLYFGEVIDVDDPFESRTIKVRIPQFDSKTENEDLPDCYPAFSPFFHFVPKVGERVIILLDRNYKSDPVSNQEKRYYLAVTISQPQNINFDPYYYTANANESDGWVKRETPISEIPEAKGSYATNTDVGLVGRDNTDVLLKDGEVLIRAGKHDNKNITKFNRENPGYIQVRYGLPNSSKETKYKTITKVIQKPAKHVINIIADTNNRLLIKVYQKNNNVFETTFSQSYSSRETLVKAAFSQLRTYKEDFPRWELKTSMEEFSNEKTIYPKSKQIVKERVEIKTPNEDTKFNGSVVNMVADKINLISHLNENNLNLSNPDGMIDSDTQLEVNNNLHPLVYGDNLVELLNLFKLFVQTHTHSYAGNAAVKDEVVKKLIQFDLDSLLDKNIKIG